MRFLNAIICGLTIFSACAGKASKDINNASVKVGVCWNGCYFYVRYRLIAIEHIAIDSVSFGK